MKIHELKSWPQFFTRVISGEKTFELRVNDRDFKLGDFLFLREYDPQTEQYSGRFQYARITYILGEIDHALQHVLHPDYVILALSLHWSTPLYVLPGQKWVSQLRPEPPAGVGGSGFPQSCSSNQKLETAALIVEKKGLHSRRCGSLLNIKLGCEIEEIASDIRDLKC